MKWCLDLFVMMMTLRFGLSKLQKEKHMFLFWKFSKHESAASGSKRGENVAIDAHAFACVLSNHPTKKHTIEFVNKGDSSRT